MTGSQVGCALKQGRHRWGGVERRCHLAYETKSRMSDLHTSPPYSVPSGRQVPQAHFLSEGCAEPTIGPWNTSGDKEAQVYSVHGHSYSGVEFEDSPRSLVWSESWVEWVLRLFLLRVPFVFFFRSFFCCPFGGQDQTGAGRFMAYQYRWIWEPT